MSGWVTDWDCGDQSCAFAEKKTGMRTNGGCRCLENRGLSSHGQLRSLREAIRSAFREGERRVREAVIAENKLHFCGGCGAEIDPSVCCCGSTGCSQMYDGHPFVPMGCNCHREERHQTILAHKAKVAALQWFHDEVAKFMNGLP